MHRLAEHAPEAEDDDVTQARETFSELLAIARRMEILAAAGGDDGKLLAAAALRITEAATIVEDSIPRLIAVTSIARAAEARGYERGISVCRGQLRAVR